MVELPAARLVEEHANLPRRAAAIVYRRVKGHMEYDELVALGNVGLVEAAARFDRQRGASFATYAWYRVHGAILDGIRRLTTLPHRTWRQLLALRGASAYLEQQTDRGEEALDQLKQALSAIRTVYLVSLDAAGETATTDSPRDALARAVAARRLREAIAALPDDERALVVKHYWEGKQLTTAGGELGISKSWSSRLHARAIDRLRGALAA